jgi:ATP-dependent helicase/nuclease subunit A
MNAAYQRNGQPVSAEAFYAIACDPRRSVAVEACAGAGKTWMLVSRIVRAMLESPPGELRPQEILAITFTKKAAGEMRERLDEWLKEFAKADDDKLRQELAIRGVLQGPHHANPAALSNLYRSVLATGRTVQIRTFHSWFAALLRNAPVAVLQRLDLPVNYTLLEDDAPARALVWRRFYTALLADDALKADYEAVVLAHGRFQTDKALGAALDKRVEFAMADALGVVDASVMPFEAHFPDLAGLSHPMDALRGPNPVLLAAARALGRASAKTFAAKGVELEQALSSGDASGVLAALLTGTGTARKFGEKIVGIEVVREAQDLVLRVQTASGQHEAWDYQQRMARLARLLLTEFSALKHSRQWVDMNDVERAAQSMLSDPVLSGWVQERLDARIKHLMIDEFQDTNPLQWQALSSWLSGYGGAGSAPSVFLVGDPKQSIYRFRRAEPQVFIAAQAFVRTALGGDLLACDHTRRNAVGVIDTVNTVMSAAAETDGYDGFRPHTTASQQPGVLGRLPPIPRSASADDDSDDTDTSSDVWRDSLTTPRELPEETRRTLEARQAAAWIARQVAGTPDQPGLEPGQIMALSRKRASLMPLRDALQALHIPAQIGEKTELIDCCEVQDIVALLDVLVSPQHDLSLARALRSPLFAVGDDALVALAVLRRNSSQSTATPWFALLQDAAQLPQALQGIGEVLRRWKGWLAELPPHDALQAIYDDGDVLARFGAAAPDGQRAAVLGNLRALLGVALALDGGRFATPYSLVRALKAGGLLAPLSLQPNAVRLLTIHGAKGLEAEAVLLLDTDTVPRNADSMTVLIDWPGQSPAPEKFVFLVSEKRPPLCAEAVLAQEQLARGREELNALYVAMTRARGMLVISSVEPHRETTHSWWQRLQALMSPVSVVPTEEATDSAAGAAPTLAATFALSVLPPLPEALQNAAAATAAVARLPAETPLSARIGKAMHRLLEWGVVAADATPMAPAAVAAAAQEFALSPDQAQEAARMAQRIASGDGAWAWQPDVIAWQGNEVDMLYQGQALRLDRLVQRKDASASGHWWVLDYKSTPHPQRQPELVNQLKTYRAAVQQAYPGAVVKAAFLTGDGRVVEVVDGV